MCGRATYRERNKQRVVVNEGEDGEVGATGGAKSPPLFPVVQKRKISRASDFVPVPRANSTAVTLQFRDEDSSEGI